MAALDVLVYYVPSADTERTLDAIFAVGAGAIGDYDRCAFVMEGRGQFRPLPGASPAIGTVGRVEIVPESRVELTFRHELREAVIEALKQAHPYEEPAFHVIESGA